MGDNLKKEDEVLLEQLEAVGDSPRYLWKLFFLCMIPSILNGLNVTSYVYLTDVPEHWCRIPALDNTTWTEEQIRNISTPNPSGSSCEMFNLNYENLAETDFEDAYLESLKGDRSTIPCAETQFAQGVPSMVLDFDLVCERTALKSSIQVAISLGKFLGALLFGIVSDKYGRRTSFLCGCLLYIISGPLIAIAGTYALVIVGRIGLGAAGSGIYHSAFVILSEIASKKRRASLGILYNMSYPIGQMIVPIIAYFVRDWRTLQIIISVPAILTLLFYWYIPESPMWLLGKNRRAQAAVYIRSQYSDLKLKSVHVPKSDDSDFEQGTGTRNLLLEQPAAPPPDQDWKSALLCKLKTSLEQVFQLLQYGELRQRLAVTFVTWCVCSFSYYGLALNVDNFDTNRYVYGFLTGLVEAPSYLLPLPLLKYMGRRYTAISLFYIGGFALLLILLIPKGSDGINVPLLLVASIGRLCVSGVFAVVILQTTELFPTLLRNSAIGIGSTASHIGSMSAPLFVDLMGMQSHSVPSTTFGLLTLFAGTLIFLLPETKNKPLPNSVQDVLDAPKEAKVGLHQVCRR